MNLIEKEMSVFPSPIGVDYKPNPNQASGHVKDQLLHHCAAIGWAPIPRLGLVVRATEAFWT